MITLKLIVQFVIDFIEKINWK